MRPLYLRWSIMDVKLHECLILEDVVLRSEKTITGSEVIESWPEFIINYL